MRALNGKSMNNQGCPICGYKEINVLDEFNCTTFEICESCGSESGCEYNQHSSVEHLNKIRIKWIVANKCKWWGRKSLKPKNWNPQKQMELAKIEFEL
jgi:hypothetical protein